MNHRPGEEGQQSMEHAAGRDNHSSTASTIIDIEAVEQRLARLWRPEATARSGATELPTRTSVLNLVIHATDLTTRDRTRAVAEQLSSVHSCRALIFTSVDRLDDRGVAPEIYATCSRDQSRPDAPCIERIDISMLPSMLDHMPSLVDPLIIPGLPIFVWWPGSPPFESHGLKSVASASDRFVLDSMSFRSVEQLGMFARLVEGLPACVPTDLNWERLQPWRELTAQFFDIRHVQWALGCVRDVEIETGQARNGELPSQALLFASWLAHCLEWNVFEARRTRSDRWYIGANDPNGEPVRIMIRTRPSSEQYAGHLLSLSIDARDDDGRTGSLSLSRSSGSALIRMHAKSGLDTALHHSVHNPLLPEAALLIRVLETTTSDHVFEASLRYAAGVIDRLGRRHEG
jgi:glucose-6-phosphate dehydrogenase assembly protein OpcA